MIVKPIGPRKNTHQKPVEAFIPLFAAIFMPAISRIAQIENMTNHPTSKSPKHLFHGSDQGDRKTTIRIAGGQSGQVTLPYY